MKIGITATRHGLTECQKAWAYDHLKKTKLDNAALAILHGDCIGGDFQIHGIAEKLELPTIIRPPSDSRYRAFCKGGFVHATKPYINRDHDIVDECDHLLGFAKGFEEELRSGTWATIRYARKTFKPVTIVFPDASFEYYNLSEVDILK